MIVDKLELNINYNISRLKDFLKRQELEFEKIDTAYIALDENGNIIASACKYRNILKLIAVEKNHRGENLLDILISKVLEEIFLEGYEDNFIFTKTSNIPIFKSFDFNIVMDTGNIVLLHRGRNDIYKTLEKNKYIKNETEDYKVGAIVLNANPFTLGHRYLITESLKYVDKLILFVVETDESEFSFEDRFRLVEEGVQDLQEVFVIPSTDYIISNNTFPTYFIKDKSKIHEEYAKLDLMIFRKYFIPFFNIKKRFVGKENVDESTRLYNFIMKKTLGDIIDIVELDRLSIDNEEISASKVRKAFKEGKFSYIKTVVPNSTYDYLRGNNERSSN